MEHREKEESSRVEGRNPVLEALRSGRSVDKVYIQAGLHDGPIQTILREARKRDAIVAFVTKERLNQMSETGNHQGVIAAVASYQYSTVEDILKRAEEKGEDPFLILLDEIEDPHNLGAIIRTANLAGAHGVIITRHRAAGLTATVAKASAGAVNYTPVAKVTNLSGTIEDLKRRGLVVCLRGHGGDLHVRPGSERPHRSGHRQRGHRSGPPGPGKMRFYRFHPHERGNRFFKRVGGCRHSCLRDRQAERIE